MKDDVTGLFPLKLRERAKTVIELPNQINRMTALVITIGIVSVLAFMMASIAMARSRHAN